MDKDLSASPVNTFFLLASLGDLIDSLKTAEEAATACLRTDLANRFKKEREEMIEQAELLVMAMKTDEN